MKNASDFLHFCKNNTNATQKGNRPHFTESGLSPFWRWEATGPELYSLGVMSTNLPPVPRTVIPDVILIGNPASN